MIWEWGYVSVPLLQSLAAKHSDVKSQHIVALLAMRGDLGRNAVIKVSSPHIYTWKLQSMGAHSQAAAQLGTETWE